MHGRLYSRSDLDRKKGLRKNNCTILVELSKKLVLKFTARLSARGRDEKGQISISDAINGFREM